MINYLKGTLVSKIEDSPTGCNITVEVNNIGYFILTNKRVLSFLPPEGENVTIYTVLIHREDSMSLCGFNAREDRDLFVILNSVSGIGTKVALAIMGELGAYNLVNAVLSDNDKAISKAKGVGTKLARKAIIELKDKMLNWRAKIPLEVAQREETENLELTESWLEAETVLLSLGYTKKEATEGLKKAIPCAENNEDAEELLRKALQWLAGQQGY
ncbi:MAG TPA: Holliday junction branch migration protein RuvA [Candidatus Gastranaerophilales bacterium]|nr:Holliday junction branch migration protein RuvA [Candidatus Gastranaerophilales bacterium]